MLGEGYQSDMVIDNIRRHDFQFVECSHVVDDIGAVKESNFNFGLCPVGESIRLSFTLTNMSQTDPIRFQWPTIPCLVFSPSVGHILPAASRDITVTFTYVKPKEYKQQRFAGKYWKISYNKPLSQVSTWDESMKKIKWINVPPVESRPSSSSSSGGKKQDAPSQDDVVIKYPLKNKVIETEPEPDHKLVDKNGEDLEVFLTAETTFAEYECPSRVIKFKDTYVLQTKAFKFPLKNTGRITLVGKWYMPLHGQGSF
jgi:hydrocephalus-inducing protein